MKKRTAIILVTCLMLTLTACSSKGDSGQLPTGQTAAGTPEAALPDNNETENETPEATMPGNNETENETPEAILPDDNETENGTPEATLPGNNETENETQEPALPDNNETENFTDDGSEDIKVEIDRAVSGSDSLQSELENVETVVQKYNQLAEEAQTQDEMNQSSQLLYTIWDTELNNLWSRFSNSADQQTKENFLADQRNWIDMKEEAVLECIGSREENGSMYPTLVNTFLEEITRNRAYILANELAKIKGESFAMPEKSKYGLFADNQGTGDIYSFLLTRQGEEGDEEAVVSISDGGKIEGTFVDNGNGELSFTSTDADGGMVTGTIKINGWDGASFTVTEAPEAYGLQAGDEFDFPFAF